MNTLLIVCIFTALIHFAETTALSMRLAGVYTRQVASSISFVNIAFLIARLSNMLQAPLLGAMVDLTVEANSGFTPGQLNHNFRVVIFAAFLGNLIGAFLCLALSEFLPEQSEFLKKKVPCRRYFLKFFIRGTLKKCCGVFAGQHRVF